jgi:hypothetical protein
MVSVKNNSDLRRVAEKRFVRIVNLDIAVCLLFWIPDRAICPVGDQLSQVKFEID